MPKSLRRLLPPMVLLALMSLPAYQSPAASDASKSVTIVYSGDLIGWLNGCG